jgi:hypothetical protein
MTELEQLLDFAQGFVAKQYLEAGEMCPMWHAQTETGENFLVMTPFENTEEKEFVSTNIKRMFLEKKVVRFVFMSEVWFKVYDHDHEPGLERPVSAEPDRKEAVFLLGEDRDTGQSMTVTLEIDRSTGKPVLKEFLTNNNAINTGRFANIFGLHRTRQ